MVEPFPKAVLEASDVFAISQLILRERASRDLGLWEQMSDCFHDDSVVRISWIKASGPEFVRRSKEMAERNVLTPVQPLDLAQDVQRLVLLVVRLVYGDGQTLVIVRPQILLFAHLVRGDHGARYLENGARGPIVLLQHHNFQIRKVILEVEDVPYIG